jgi:predicted alpha/beta hydrolase family esterase
MKDAELATVLIVPGLRDHVPAHWQTHLEHTLSATRKVVSGPPLLSDKPAAVVCRLQLLASPRYSRRIPPHWQTWTQTGSELVNVGAVSHLNPASGFGPWKQADEFVALLDK